MRGLYLRLVGAVFAVAFVSMASQVELLIGTEGLDPVAPKLAAARAEGAGASIVYANPTLFWLADGDFALSAVCWIGAAVSLGLTALVFPRGCLAALWGFYLSLVTA